MKSLTSQMALDIPLRKPNTGQKIHTCIHTYIHTYIDTYIHTYIQQRRTKRKKRQRWSKILRASLKTQGS